MDFFPLVKAIYDKIPNITADEIKDMQRAFAKEKKMKDLPSKSQILQSYFAAVSEGKLEKNQTFEMLLRKRAIRSLSGIVSVQVLTKPWPCPGKCIFCPNDPGMPKSYIKSEPGAMRAWLNQFDPLKQTYNRLQSLTTTGHQTDKIEMIVLGGSWDAYPRDYKIDFVKQLYDACNTFSELKIQQGGNESPFGKGEAPKEQGDIYKKQFLAYNPNLVEKAKELRKNMTKAEKKLRYEYLQSLEVKVLRQQPIDEYIVDFYIASKKFVIEINGDTHWSDKEIQYDKKRTEKLETIGLKVIRFTNDEVLNNFEAVCEEINKMILDIPPLSPLAEGGQEPSKYHFEILNLDEIKYSDSLEEVIKRNETAKNRIIGLTIETRPDLVSHENCKFWRELGVTRVEMGIQSTNDEVLELNKRGHNVQKIKDAIHIMRQYGFKISIHLMPGLYGSNFEKDIQSFKDIYSNSDFQPDEIKFYPTSVIPNTELYNLYKEGKYIPIITEQILDEIRETFLNIIPPYTRIKRLIRDIPATEIVAGSNITNLSQMAHESLLKEMKNSFHGDGNIDVEKFYRRLYGEYELYESEEGYFEKKVISNVCSASGEREKSMSEKSSVTSGQLLSVKEYKSGFLGDASKGQMITEIIGLEPDLKSFRNFVCLDTRSREVRNRIEKKKSDFLNLVLRWYKSSAGQECFISFEDELGYLYGFARLLLPNQDSVVGIEGLEKGTAIIRELHVYGELQKIGEKSGKGTQHTGLGKRLLLFAERLSKSFGYNQFSVISGVGVREYYKGVGFELRGTYMSKDI